MRCILFNVKNPVLFYNSDVRGMGIYMAKVVRYKTYVILGQEPEDEL